MGWNKVGGESGATTTRANVYVQIEPGKPKRVHALLDRGEEPLSYWTHWLNNVKQSVICPGKSVCPACKAGINAKMQHAMNVWDYTEKQVRVLEKGNQVYEPIKMAFDMAGNTLDTVDIIIKQVGSGLETKYVVTTMALSGEAPTGPKLDIENLCRKADPEHIAKLLGDKIEFGDTDPKAKEPEVGYSLPGEVLMPTGKYKGQRLDEIVKSDRNYVEWVAENFEDVEIVDAAKEALAASPTRKAIEPKPALSLRDKKIAESLKLVDAYRTKAGNLKAVAQIMKDVAKKSLLKDFTEAELDTFIEEMKTIIESLEFDAN